MMLAFLTPHQRKIYDYLDEHGECGYESLCEAVGGSQAFNSINLRELVYWGHAHSRTEDNHSFWSLAHPGPIKPRDLLTNMWNPANLSATV